MSDGNGHDRAAMPSRGRRARAAWLSAGTCVFCQRADRPMTREHIFARWLVQKIHGARIVPSVAHATPSLEALPISKVIAPVCAECNAGWMSSLEVSFRHSVFVLPRVGLLQPSTRVTLSRWFTKTAVLLADAHRVEFLSAAERSRMLVGMPDGIEVFLGRRRRPRQPLDFAVDVATDRGALRVRAVAIQVGDLLAHVAPRDILSAAHGTRLWPLRTHALRWQTLPVVTLGASARER